MEQRNCVEEYFKDPSSMAWLGIQDWVKEEILLFGDQYKSNDK